MKSVPSAEIHHRLAAMFSDNCLSRSRVYEWCARFHDGRQSVSDDVHIAASRTAMTADNVDRADKNSSGDELANVNFYAECPGSYPNSQK